MNKTKGKGALNGKAKS